MVARCPDGQHYFLKVTAYMTGTTAALDNAYACFECGVVRVLQGVTLTEYDLTTGGWIALNGQEDEPTPPDTAAPRQRKR